MDHGRESRDVREIYQERLMQNAECSALLLAKSKALLTCYLVGLRVVGYTLEALVGRTVEIIQPMQCL